MGELGTKQEGKNLPELDCPDDLSVLVKNISKISELFEVLTVQGATIGLKISFKTKVLSLQINEV